MNQNHLEQTSRLVAWRIYNVDNPYEDTLISKEFFIGKWFWVMEYAKAYGTIYLTLQPKCTQTLPSPIASFDIHVFCSKGNPVVTTEKGSRDMNLTYERCGYCLMMDASKLHGGVPVTIGLEFLDLKMEDANDGLRYSIWNEESLEQNTSNDEPVSRMLSESIYTDIIINTRDGSIKAHRAVLAANSLVFKAMFSRNYIEKETSIVNIDDMSIGACRAMLNFFYGKRRSNELRAHIMELILAADKYDVVDLKKACEASLCENVGAKNVFEKLICAHTYDLTKLKGTCLFFLMQMGMIFELREDYNSFMREADPELVTVVANACLDAWRLS